MHIVKTRAWAELSKANSQMHKPACWFSPETKTLFSSWKPTRNLRSIKHMHGGYLECKLDSNEQKRALLRLGQIMDNKKLDTRKLVITRMMFS